VWLAGGLVLLATAIFTGCGNDQATGHVGETVAAGDYQLLVTNMDNPAQPPDRFTNPKPGNRFVKFDFTVTNLGNQHLPVAASYFTLRDTANIDYPPREGITSDTVLKQTSLSPGQRVQASLYFEMAANQSPAQLIFAPGVLGWRTRITIDLR